MYRPMCFCVLIVLLLHSTSFAGPSQINERTRLGPSSQTKVNRALARSYIADLGISSSQSPSDAGQGGCGNTEIGTLTNTRSSRIENVTVVRGDVITISRNTKCQ